MLNIYALTFLKFLGYYIVTKIQFFIFPFLFSSSMNRRRQPAVFAFVGQARQPVRARCIGHRYFPYPLGIVTSCDIGYFLSGRPDSQCVHSASRFVTSHSCCGARHSPWHRNAIVDCRPLPLAQVAPPAIGGAPIAPPLGIVTLYDIEYFFLSGSPTGSSCTAGQLSIGHWVPLGIDTWFVIDRPLGSSSGSSRLHL